MHLNHYENPYSRLARYELRMRQHGLTAQAMLMTSDNTQLRTIILAIMIIIILAAYTQNTYGKNAYRYSFHR